MEERLKQRLEVTKKALGSFGEVLSLEFSTIVRDASIQRFEYCVESVWKLAQLYLKIYDGIEIASPKGIFRACLQAGLLTEKQTEAALLMVNDRNLTVHMYNEELSNEVYNNLSLHYNLLKKLYKNITAKVKFS